MLLACGGLERASRADFRCGHHVRAGGRQSGGGDHHLRCTADSPEFAAKSGQDPALFETRYAATGMVVCSGVYSTAQLTIKDDVVTTAAHAFYDTDGNPRGDLATCHFNILVEGRQLAIPLDVASLEVGSRNPYAVAPVHDWAVVRLVQHVPAAQPYGIQRTGSGRHADRDAGAPPSRLDP